MPRVARKHIVTRSGGFFHVLNRIGGYPGEYPLNDPRVIADFISRLRCCVASFCIHCAGFVLMGNHYHLVLFAEPFRKLSRRKLERLASARWGKLWKLRTALWPDSRWEQFNRQVFEMKDFMRDLQGPFATFFNKLFGRRGRLWGNRYTSLALERDVTAVQEVLYYTELNPVRAGLTDLARQWKAGSAFLRSIGQADFLIGLEDLFPELARAQVLPFYRAMLLYRGVQPDRANQAGIPAEVAARELQRGIPPGLHLKRLRFMIDGLMMGTRESVLQKLEELIQQGVYSRRRNVTEQLGGMFYTVREQRSHCRW